MLKEIFKEKLQKEIIKTEKKIAKAKAMKKPVVAEGAKGRASKMIDINNVVIASTILNESKLRLKRLTRVLSLIDTKDFGKCIKCKKKISASRILARPESLLCVKCAP